MNHPLINIFCAVAGGIITYAFGGWNPLLGVFIVTMAIDCVTGIAAAIKSGKGLSSKTGFWGLTRKGIMLMVVSLAHQIDLLLGIDAVQAGAIYFYLFNEVISIAENFNVLGLPLPPMFRDMLAGMRDKQERNTKDKDN
ncbi:phage holin family protein [Paenibacillus sp. P96]|uniref:Phage holin family protein n=1 Tax=Paenibacillus zeirhizosphaerae TaxID=2987519 RepID=A0ABT9FSQ8_9BACL|nr:phage holin family protein [Paenibacillus sp. P96]MDP4097773.1 phage holin family protein [Paenibacillus sp. P96]